MKYLPYILAIIAHYFIFAFIELNFYFILEYKQIETAGFLFIGFICIALVYNFKQIDKKK